MSRYLCAPCIEPLDTLPRSLFLWYRGESLRHAASRAAAEVAKPTELPTPVIVYAVPHDAPKHRNGNPITVIRYDCIVRASP